MAHDAFECRRHIEPSALTGNVLMTYEPERWNSSALLEASGQALGLQAGTGESASERQNGSRSVWLSAVTGDGIPELLGAIEDRLRRKKVRGMIRLQPGQGRQ